jgi:hypothetical protein
MDVSIRFYALKEALAMILMQVVFVKILTPFHHLIDYHFDFLPTNHYFWNRHLRHPAEFSSLQYAAGVHQGTFSLTAVSMFHHENET